NPADCRRPGRAGAAAPWSLTAEHAAHADVAAGAVAVGGEPALQAPAAVVRGTPQADAQRALVLVGTKARVVRRRTGHVRRLAHGHRGGHAGVDLLLQLVHAPVQMPHIALHLVEPLVGVLVGGDHRMVDAGVELVDVDRIGAGHAGRHAGNGAVADVDLARGVAAAHVRRVVTGLRAHGGGRALAQRHAVVMRGLRTLADRGAVGAAGHGLVAQRRAVVAAGVGAAAARSRVGSGRGRRHQRGFLADLERTGGTGLQVRHVTFHHVHAVTQVVHVTRHLVELADVDGIGVIHAGRHVGERAAAGVDAVGGHARAAVDHQAGIAQVHVIAHLHAVGIDDGVAGSDAVHVKVTVEGDFHLAVVVLAGLGNADVAVTGEGHRAVRADVGGIAVRIGRRPAGVGRVVGRADRIVDVVVPGPTDIAGGDGAVRVEFGVAADHVHDRITHAVQLAAVDGIRAGGADLARGDVGDHQVAGVDAGDGHARPTVDHQAGIAQVHVGADRHAGGVDVGITGGHAIDRYVVGQVEHQVGTVPVDLDIAVVVAEVDRAAGANVVVGHRAFAVHRYIPAGVGHVADLLE